MSDYGDITQSMARSAVGIPTSNAFNGKNYANFVNTKARDRLVSYRRSIRRLDSLQAINRYTYTNLPIGIRDHLLERINYYRREGMFYWDETLGQYFYLPFAMISVDNDSINFYGEYVHARPLPFNGKSTTKKAVDKKTVQEVYLGTISREPVRDLETLKKKIEVNGREWCKNNLCVICHDYSEQLSQSSEPMSIIQETWINSQAELPLFFRTAILKALTPKLLKTSDQGTMDAVIAELQSIEDSILEGKTIIPVTAFQDLQDIDTSSNVTALVESVLKSYESIDNIRKSQLGIANNGAFRKSSQMLQSEQDVNNGSTDLIAEDGLRNRQEFIELANELFELNMTVEESNIRNESIEEKDDTSNPKENVGGDVNDNEPISD